MLSDGGGGIQGLQEDYGAHLRLLMWASALVLLIACANIANLLLARGMARKAEMSVRTALGAGRMRIMRQLLTESVLLAGFGGLAGIALAYAATQMQRGLVVAQAALSLILLVGAGLFSQSLNKLQHTDLKLDAKNRYIVHIDPQTAGYSQRQVGDLYRTIEARFHAIPGVSKVGICNYTPMEDNNNSTDVQIQGKPDPHMSTSLVKVTEEYFDAVGTRVLMGRGFTPQDTPASTTVAVVNETFVKKLFQPGENPIGHHFGSGPKNVGDFEIVGGVPAVSIGTRDG